VHVHGPATGPRLWISAALTGGFVLFELAVGWLANSLALISDAGHNLTDAAALVLSAWAFALASRPPDRDRSFGFHRAGVLAALVNAATLALLALYIFHEGYQRLMHPEPVQSLPMIVVAAVALALNTAIAWWLHAAGQQDVNIKSAFVHLVGDALASVGVIVAGLAVWWTGSPVWDPLVSVLIGLFIVWSSWGIIKETIDILMESTPSRVRVDELVRDVEAVPGVRDIHDLHVWALGSSVHALSAHLVVEDTDRASNGELVRVVRRVKQVLAERHGIAHATLETHCSDGDTDCLPCEIHPNRPRRHEHGHEHTHDQVGHRH
jgi:cobalt-zinc-cadmium efflux system protein